MDWSPRSATNAYLDALKLCNKCQRECTSCESPQIPKSNEFISALAAGMSAKLIVEVTSQVSPSTVALAVAARQTGGKLVCILPEPDAPNPSRRAIHESGLNDMVEFRASGDPAEALFGYDNIDFSLVDFKSLDQKRLSLGVNPRRSVVVASNLVEGEKGFGPGHLRGVEGETRVRSMKHPVGRGMEITMIGKGSDFGKRRVKRSKSGSYCMGRFDRNGGGGGDGGARVRSTDRSKWVFQVDDKSGEEHIFRMPKSRSEVFEVQNEV
ncbi:hypothetical protein STAS_23382 [Striga asiatica]|uniref:Uncharacterized protein n=1 Tax=Striga asiatica TaxID=4170 RepID=A0A5A7QR10_STRAF|nr:hypothetical protein STAS_23382 [Striga asiatica]